jgi:K(+)-stimulated pyrophosphate-energized sodium pump
MQAVTTGAYGAVELAVKLTADAGAGVSHVLAAVFFLVALVFVWRSFYGMRIGSESA